MLSDFKWAKSSQILDAGKFNKCITVNLNSLKHFSSGLKNKGARHAAVPGVTKSQRQLSNWTAPTTDSKKEKPLMTFNQKF